MRKYQLIITSEAKKDIRSFGQSGDKVIVTVVQA